MSSKIPEYYGIGEIEKMTPQQLGVTLEDMYQRLAFAANSQSSSSGIDAWGCFAGTGPIGAVTFTHSFNVASISHDAVGGYTVTLSSAMTGGADYAVLVSCSSGTYKTFSGYQIVSDTIFRIFTWKMDVYHPVDAPHISFSVIQ
jgi:hypothetical protein